MGGGIRTPLELGSTGGRHPKPKALEVKASTWESSGLASTRKAHLGNKVRRRRVRQWYGKSRHTQEYESFQQNDMEVDKEEGMEELTFVPSAVSDSAGWHEPLRVKYMCDQKCNKEGFKFYDIAAILVEDDGKPHTINLCRNCFNLRLAERNESVVTNVRWKAMIEQKVSRQSVGRLRVRWFRQKGVGRCAVKNLWAKDLVEEATKAVQLEKSWPAESPHKEELELLRVRSGLRLDGTLIRQAMKAGKAGRWSSAMLPR